MDGRGPYHQNLQDFMFTIRTYDNLCFGSRCLTLPPCAASGRCPHPKFPAFPAPGARICGRGICRGRTNHIAVSTSWGSVFVGVLRIRGLLGGVFVRAPDFRRRPHKHKDPAFPIQAGFRKLCFAGSPCVSVFVWAPRFPKCHKSSRAGRPTTFLNCN